MNSTLYSYLETALWSSPRCDEEGNMLGNYDDDFGPDAFDEASLKQAATDLESFLEEAAELLEGHDDEQAAHDFWLTRNGHGAGFWDGDYQHGDKLTELAKAYGSTDVYETDDGELALT